MSRILYFLYPVDTTTRSQSLLLLATRIIFGLLLMTHGVAKWQHFDALASAFPDPLGLGSRAGLMLAIFAEVFCAAGFIVGAFYRLALIPMIFTMGMAAFVVHHGTPFAEKELAVVYLAVFVLMFFAGAGRYALDTLVAGALRKK